MRTPFSILFFLLAIASFGQVVDSGFTNKAEAKNLTVNGLKQGKWVEYFHLDKYANSFATQDSNKAEYYRLTIYVGDKASGYVYEYYKGGILKNKSLYINGKEEGTEKEYNYKGELCYDIQYTNGLRNGIEKEYNRKGIIFSEFVWVNDDQYIWRTYFNNGKLDAEYFYDNDYKRDRYYFRNGKLKQELIKFYKVGHDIENIYSRKGQLKRKRVYINGLNYRELKIDISKTDSSNNMVLKEYYNGGKLWREVDYVGDKINGKETWFYPDGNKWCELMFKEGKYDGTGRWYDEIGHIQFEIPYSNGKVDGIEKEYYTNGKLKSYIPLINGKINGTEQEYYPDGKLQRETTYSNDVPGLVKNYDTNGNEVK